MWRHLWAHHADFASNPANEIPDISANCPYCDELIGRPDNMKRHIDEVHLGIKRETSRRGVRFDTE